MVRKLIYSLLIGFLFCWQGASVLASSYSDPHEKDEVPTKGDWTEQKRSIPKGISVSVAWDGANLYIENPSGRSEIQVSISSGFETVLPVGTTSAVVYVGAIDGPCVLVLTNQFGDRVEGLLD